MQLWYVEGARAGSWEVYYLNTAYRGWMGGDVEWYQSLSAERSRG